MTPTVDITYTVRTHDEGDGCLWAEVVELPGCFASGRDQAELDEALTEAISLYLSTPQSPVEASIERTGPVAVSEQRILVH